jgi:transposase
MAPGQRWSVARKREVMLHLLRGDSVEAVSPELGVEKSTDWRSGATWGMQASMLRSRNGRATRSRRGWMRR